MSSFDYKSLLSTLRAHFATAADNQGILRRLDFEEAMARRNGGRSSVELQVAKILIDTVPDLQAHVLSVAMIVRHSTGMVGEHLNSMEPAERDLYLRCRQSPSLLGVADPLVCQVLLSMQIAGAQAFLDTPKEQYIHFADAQRLNMALEKTSMVLQLRPGISGAVKLEELFQQKAAEVAAACSPDVFFKRGTRGPGR